MKILLNSPAEAPSYEAPPSEKEAVGRASGTSESIFYGLASPWFPWWDKKGRPESRRIRLRGYELPDLGCH
jgi:hypothetical protein